MDASSPGFFFDLYGLENRRHRFDKMKKEQPPKWLPLTL